MILTMMNYCLEREVIVFVLRRDLYAIMCKICDHVEWDFRIVETRWRARASKMVARGLHSPFDARAQAICRLVLALRALVKLESIRWFHVTNDKLTRLYSVFPAAFCKSLAASHMPDANTYIFPHVRWRINNFSIYHIRFVRKEAIFIAHALKMQILSKQTLTTE